MKGALSGPGHGTHYESHSENILLASICLPDFLFSTLEEEMTEEINPTAAPEPNPESDFEARLKAAVETVFRNLHLPLELMRAGLRDSPVAA